MVNKKDVQGVFHEPRRYSSLPKWIHNLWTFPVNKKKTQYFEKDPVHFSIIKINMESHPKKHTKVVCIYLCDIYVAKITQNSLPLSKEV